MKKSLSVITVLILILSVFFIIKFFTINPALKDVIQHCKVIGKTHLIQLKNNKFIPQITYANSCDTVVIVNQDKNTLYLPAFGHHPNHIIYDDFAEKTIGFGQKNSFVVRTKGDFNIHDHLKDEAEGEIIVK